MVASRCCISLVPHVTERKTKKKRKKKKRFYSNREAAAAALSEFGFGLDSLGQEVCSKVR